MNKVCGFSRVRVQVEQPILVLVLGVESARVHASVTHAIPFAYVERVQ